jgi:thioredoxin 1
MNSILHAILVFCFAACGLFATDSFKIVDITGDEAISSAAYDINQNGQVCGILLDAKDQKWKLFVWDRAEGIRTIVQESFTTPVIGGKGEVYGTLLQRGWFWNSYLIFVWTPDGKVQEIYNPKWSNTVVVDANSHGDVLVADRHAKETGVTRYAIYKNGLFQDIPLDSITTLRKISENGNVVGHGVFTVGTPMSFVTVQDPEGRNQQHLTFVEPTVPTFLGASGEVLGVSQLEAAHLLRGFLWKTEENSLLRMSNFAPVSMNQQQQIVGFDNDKNIYFNENGQYQKLNLMVEPEDVEDPVEWTTLLTVKKINDLGQIIGTGTKVDRVKAYLLEPAEGVAVTGGLKKVESPVHVSDINFEALIANGTHLVLFYSEWCGHCKKIQGEVDKVEKFFKERLTVLRANSQHLEKARIRHDVKAYPTLILFQDGMEVNRITGYHDFPSLKLLLNRAL